MACRASSSARNKLSYAGRHLAGPAARIAAICRFRGAVLATRNLPDFDGTGIDTIDPWAPANT